MSTESIVAVQSRMQELRALVSPSAVTVRQAAASSATSLDGATAGTTTSDSTAAAFRTALAAATGTAGLSTATTGGSNDPGIAPGSGVTAQDLVETAKKYLGVPYVWGGESLSEGGLDCSGLVLRSLTDLGVDGIPRTAHEQMRLGTKVDSMDEAEPGDLLVFGGGTHIAIYLGDGKMIDAPKPGGHVNIRDVYTDPTAIRRILPQEGATAAAVPAGFASLGGDTTSLARMLGAGTTSASTLSGLASAAGLSNPTSSADLSASSTDASRIVWELLAGVAS